MNIPQEIQDLMPSLTNGKTYDLEWSRGYKSAIADVEAVLPKMLAVAEKRGAEEERERIRKIVEFDVANASQGEASYKVIERVLQTLTNPNNTKED